jgi:hypothetical protein
VRRKKPSPLRRSALSPAAKPYEKGALAKKATRAGLSFRARQHFSAPLGFDDSKKIIFL